MAPVVSVLMAVYNREAFLATAIESVLAQTRGDVELIVSDNVSTDATPEIALRYARQDSRVRYFRNDAHVSAVENFNLCFRRSNPDAPYFALLASDDWWEPCLLDTLVGVADAHPDIAVAHADMYRTDATGRIIGRYTDIFPARPPGGRHRAVRELYDGNYINIMAAVVNRSVWRRVTSRTDLFDPSLKLTPDYLFWLELLSHGGDAYYVPEALAYYRKHDDAMTMPKNTIPSLQEEISIFREKLAGIPSELEPYRRSALHRRMAQLGFELLQVGRTSEAIAALDASRRVASGRRLDVQVARLLSILPMSKHIAPRLWAWAGATAAMVRRA